jgi:hypothetical protein
MYIHVHVEGLPWVPHYKATIYMYIYIVLLLSIPNVLSDTDVCSNNLVEGLPL